MKIDIFQSSHGDCLLLESVDGRRILCDGGMKSAMVDDVGPVLARLRQAEPDRPLDLIYVSHIDADHIGGVLQLLEDELAWRVHAYHENQGDDFEPPERGRPPKIGGIWHNAFADIVETNTGAVEDLLAAAAPALLATRDDQASHAAFDIEQVGLGVDHALKVSKLIDPRVLDVPLNVLPGTDGPAKLLMARPGQEMVRLGSFEITIVGPTQDELDKLRIGWNRWLARSPRVVGDINREIKRRMQMFSSSDAPPAALDFEGVPGFRNVTVPNIASLVLHVRDGGRTLLLTGDAQHDLLLEHLELAGLLKSGSLHLDVLKIQHHGSEHNMSPKFARAVSADHYVFCGDGSNGNPELEVLQQVFDSRVSGDADVRAAAPEAGDRPFDFWFSTSTRSGRPHGVAGANFREVEQRVGELVVASNGRLTAHFNDDVSLRLDL